MSGFDPSSLARGVWSSLASFPDLLISSRSRAGSSSQASWQSWLAREQARLGWDEGVDPLSSSSTRSSWSLPELPTSTASTASPRGWLDAILGLLPWGDRGAASPSIFGKLAAAEDTLPRERSRDGARSVGNGCALELVPSQFDPSLSAREAYAACGPAAAVALARASGRNLSLREVVDLAKTVGWTPAGGMNGVANQKRLLEKIGVPASLDTSGDWDRVARQVSAGKPVTISTAGHYFVADAYDPQTGRFHVGASGTAYRDGKEWMTREEMETLAGPINGTLVLDKPRGWMA